MKITADDLLNSLPRSQLLSMIDSNNSCKGLLTGYISEQILLNKLLTIPGVDSVSKIPDQDSKKGDLLVKYRDKFFSIEVKCLRSNTDRETWLEGGISGQVKVSLTDSTELEDGKRTWNPIKGEFDILAICTVTLTGNWDFYFIHNKYLPTSKHYPNRLKSTIRINTENTPCLYSDILRVIPDIN